MTDNRFTILCQDVLDATEEMDLINIAEKIDKYRKTIDSRDFAILQSLILCKGNELAITNLLEAVTEIQLIEDGMVEAPPHSERH